MARLLVLPLGYDPVHIGQEAERDHVQEATHVTVRDQMCGAFNVHVSISENTLMYGYCTAVILKCKLRKNEGSVFTHIIEKHIKLKQA